MRLLVLLLGCGFTPKMTGAGSKCPQHHLIGFFYCDGFEDGLDDRYQKFGSDGALGLDGIHTYRGASSLHLHADDGAGDAGMSIGTGLSADSSDFINIDSAESDLRVFMYLTGGPVTPNVRLVTLGGLQLYLTSGDLVLGLDRVASMVADRWVCVELKLAMQGGLWVGSVSLDGGAPVVMGAQLGDPANGFSVQLQHNDPAPALDAWFDEVVLDHQPIGCDS